MNRQSVVGVVVAVAVGVLTGCSRTDAPPGPGGPTLSLVGAYRMGCLNGLLD